jgi:hypothetical protein
MAMNTPPAIPPVVSPNRTITYEITRADIFANWMLVILRNRILQVFVPLMFLLNAWIFLAPGLGTRPFSHTLFMAVAYTVSFFGFLAVVQGLAGFANAFIFKHRGVLGRHYMEITDQGLIERTEFNDTVHRWPAIRRIISMGGYLFIYVSDNNSHQIPKRCFSPQEFASFEADLRARAR